MSMTTRTLTSGRSCARTRSASKLPRCEPNTSTPCWRPHASRRWSRPKTRMSKRLKLSDSRNARSRIDSGEAVDVLGDLPQARLAAGDALQVHARRASLRAAPEQVIQRDRIQHEPRGAASAEHCESAEDLVPECRAGFGTLEPLLLHASLERSTRDAVRVAREAEAQFAALQGQLQLRRLFRQERCGELGLSKSPRPARRPASAPLRRAPSRAAPRPARSAGRENARPVTDGRCRCARSLCAFGPWSSQAADERGMAASMRRMKSNMLR